MKPLIAWKAECAWKGCDMKNNKGNTLAELLAVLAMLATLGIGIAILSFGVSTCQKVQKQGLKSVVEKLWYGDGKK